MRRTEKVYGEPCLYCLKDVDILGYQVEPNVWSHVGCYLKRDPFAHLDHDPDLVSAHRERKNKDEEDFFITA